MWFLSVMFRVFCSHTGPTPGLTSAVSKNTLHLATPNGLSTNHSHQSGRKTPKQKEKEGSCVLSDRLNPASCSGLPVCVWSRAVLTEWWVAWCQRWKVAAAGLRWRDVWLETSGPDLYHRAAYCLSSPPQPIYLFTTPSSSSSGSVQFVSNMGNGIKEED